MYNIRIFLKIYTCHFKCGEMNCYDQISIHDYCLDVFKKVLNIYTDILLAFLVLISVIKYAQKPGIQT